MSGPPQWGVSSLDWRSHAVDVDSDHPYGVYVARCGQRLFMGASLYGEPPPAAGCAWRARGGPSGTPAR